MKSATGVHTPSTRSPPALTQKTLSMQSNSLYSGRQSIQFPHWKLTGREMFVAQVGGVTSHELALCAEEKRSAEISSVEILTLRFITGTPARCSARFHVRLAPWVRFGQMTNGHESVYSLVDIQGKVRLICHHIHH